MTSVLVAFDNPRQMMGGIPALILMLKEITQKDPNILDIIVVLRTSDLEWALSLKLTGHIHPDVEVVFKDIPIRASTPIYYLGVE